MCGIAGFYGLRHHPDESPRLLARMLSALFHRGPDEQGYYFDTFAGLATARLAIIDVVGGTQPMCTPDRRYWLSYNGEVFNYLELRAELEAERVQFATTSDTEVVLRALVRWDVNAFRRFNGQFALQFYDAMRHRVLLGRDRFGERPLFYSRVGTGLALASEIKGIFALPEIERRLAPAVLRRLFQLWTPLPYETCFENIAALEPGHFAVFADQELTIRSYHTFPRTPDTTAMTPGDAAEHVRDAVRESVRLRLRSDVEVGTYLSGGLDSSITTTLAQQISRRAVRTFAIGFCDEAYDEGAHQTLVQQQLKTRHHALKVSRADLAHAFPDVVWHAETALFRTAPAPMFHLSRLVQETGIKVVLTGEGADEAFLGYNIFKETLLRHGLEALPSDAERIQAVKGLYPYLAHFGDANAAMLLRIFLRFTKEKTPGLFSHEVRFANGAFASGLLRGPKNTAESDGAEEALSVWVHKTFGDWQQRQLIERAQLLEYITLLSGYLLSSQGDRMTSAHSVEGRCPFLDPSVVAAGFSLPVHMRLGGGERRGPGRNEKQVLKDAFASILPAAVVQRPKQPYRAPDASTFTRTAGDACGDIDDQTSQDPSVVRKRLDWIADALSPRSLERVGLFALPLAQDFVARMQKMPAEKISPRQDSAFVLLLSTVLLHRCFVESLPGSAFERPLRLVRRIDGRRAPE